MTVVRLVLSACALCLSSSYLFSQTSSEIIIENSDTAVSSLAEQTPMIPNLNGVWLDASNREIEFLQDQNFVVGIDLSNYVEVFRASISGMNLTGGVLGRLPEGDVRATCPEWDNTWQEGSWSLSKDHNTISGSYYPVWIEGMPFFQVCGNRQLPPERSSYTRLYTTDDMCLDEVGTQLSTAPLKDVLRQKYSEFHPGNAEEDYLFLSVASRSEAHDYILSKPNTGSYFEEPPSNSPKILLDEPASDAYELIHSFKESVFFADFENTEVIRSGAPQFEIESAEFQLGLSSANWAVSRIYLSRLDSRDPFSGTEVAYRGVWVRDLWFQDEAGSWYEYDPCKFGRCAEDTGSNNLIGLAVDGAEVVIAIAPMGKGGVIVKWIKKVSGNSRALIPKAGKEILASQLSRLSPIAKSIAGKCLRLSSSLGRFAGSVVDDAIRVGMRLLPSSGGKIKQHASKLLSEGVLARDVFREVRGLLARDRSMTPSEKADLAEDIFAEIHRTASDGSSWNFSRYALNDGGSIFKGSSAPHGMIIDGRGRVFTKMMTPEEAVQLLVER